MANPRDSDAFGALTLELLQKPDEAMRLGQQARQRVQERFLIDDLQLFERVLR